MDLSIWLKQNPVLKTIDAGQDKDSIHENIFSELESSL